MFLYSSYNSSPDIPFDRSINPYQGCEHGCIYCYARPRHSYLGLSPGLDFETRVFYKHNAASCLLEEWEKPGYECKPIKILKENNIPTSVLMAPLIPAINEAEIEAVLDAAASAGAANAHYIFLRLPHELRALFVEWLESHFPDRAAHVMSLVRQAGGGHDYDNRFGIRQTGSGAYADMLGKRFRAACRHNGLALDRYQQHLDCGQFEPPGQRQLGLNL